MHVYVVLTILGFLFSALSLGLFIAIVIQVVKFLTKKR